MTGSEDAIDRVNAGRVGRLQTRLALLVALVLVLSTAGVAALSRWSRPLDWMFQRQMRIWHETNVAYAYDVGYTDSDDRLLLEDIWETDYRRGGVFFIGSSTTQHTIATWLLPATERPLVHNFAIKSANYAEQFRFVRYLTERRGLLSAGPGKTMVVLGLAHFDTRPKVPGSTDWNYIPALFDRHGLYQYDPLTGLTDRPLPWPWRIATRERMRAYDFLKALGNHAAFAGRPFGTIPPRSARDDLAARRYVHEMMGSNDWKQNMYAQLSELEKMIDYLRAHGAVVAAVLLPLESWNRTLPEAEEFHRHALEIAQAHALPVTDMTWSLPDSDFADSSHLNYFGQQEMTRVMGDIARRHLERANLGSSR